MKRRACSTLTLIGAGVLFTFLAVSPVSAQVLLCIDPGHGDSDPGALTHIPNYSEKRLNLQIAEAMLDTLQYNGWVLGTHVVFTRQTDVAVLLKRRAQIANDAGAEAFISIHHNASGNPNTVQGSETWYSSTEIISGCGGGYDGQFHDTDDSLAMKLFYRLRDDLALENPNRGFKDTCCLTVLKCTKMVSALTEAAFINAPHFDDMADTFYYDWGNIRGIEAGAILQGWSSFRDGQGIAIVDLDFVGRDEVEELDVYVDGYRFPRLKPGSFGLTPIASRPLQLLTELS